VICSVPKNKVEERGASFVTKNVAFPATLSPRSTPRLPCQNTTLRHPNFSKNPAKHHNHHTRKKSVRKTEKAVLPDGRPARAAPTSWGCIPASPRTSRWSVVKILPRDQRERQPKGYTSHEVTAPRAAGFSLFTQKEHPKSGSNQRFSRRGLACGASLCPDAHRPAAWLRGLVGCGRGSLFG
jgi:hypothetical protein